MAKSISRNHQLFYYKGTFIPFFQLWIKTLSRRKDIVEMQVKKNSGLMSIANAKLIYDDLYAHKELLTKKELEELEQAEQDAENTQSIKEGEDETSN